MDFLIVYFYLVHDGLFLIILIDLICPHRVGVFLGTFIHQLVSEQVLIVLLVILLSVTSHTTLSKAMRMYRAEVSTKVTFLLVKALIAAQSHLKI